MVNELENFSAAYVASWIARDCVVFLPESFCVRCRLLPEASALVSIPATLADRLEDTKVVEDTAVKLASTNTRTKTRLSYKEWVGSRLVPRRAVPPRLELHGLVLGDRTSPAEPRTPYFV